MGSSILDDQAVEALESGEPPKATCVALLVSVVWWFGFCLFASLSLACFLYLFSFLSCVPTELIMKVVHVGLNMALFFVLKDCVVG